MNKVYKSKRTSVKIEILQEVGKILFCTETGV